MCTLQGNCTGPKPSSLELAEGLRPQQCILVSDERIIQPTAGGKHELWWDNIYVLARRNPEDRLVWPLGWAAAGNKLWVTNSTIEGDSFNSTALVVNTGCNVYAGGAWRRGFPEPVCLCRHAWRRCTHA